MKPSLFLAEADNISTSAKTTTGCPTIPSDHSWAGQCVFLFFLEVMCSGVVQGMQCILYSHFSVPSDAHQHVYLFAEWVYFKDGHEFRA